MIVLRIRHPGEAEITNLEITGRVEQQIAGLQISVEDVGRVDVLEAPQYLVEKVADVIIAQTLGLQQFVQVGLHQTLDDVNILHRVLAGGSQDVSDINDVFMIKSGQDLDLSQGSLTVGLVFKGADFLNGDLDIEFM